MSNDIESFMAAAKIMRQAMQSDIELAWCWHCNFAMAYIDEGATHEQGNKAAARAMLNAFGVDMTQHPYYMAFEWAKAI